MVLATLNLVGLIFLLIPILAFLAIVYAQYTSLDASAKLIRVQVLSTRLSLFLPFYAVLIYASLVYPMIYELLSIPIAIVEGASFYSFFSLMVTNLGGPNAFVDTMTKLSRAPICCGSCCSSDPQQRYNSVQKAIKILLTFRVFLVNIAAIGIYAGTLGGLIVYFVTTLISAGMVLYTIASLAIMFEIAFPVSKNFMGVSKIFLMKASVGLLVLEGIIESFLAKYTPARNGFTGAEYAVRIFSFVLLVEFTVMTPFYFYVFSRKITPPDTVYLGVDMKSDHFDKQEPCDAPSSFLGFLSHVLSVWDYGHDARYSMNLNTFLLAITANSAEDRARV